MISYKKQTFAAKLAAKLRARLPWIKKKKNATKPEEDFEVTAALENALNEALEARMAAFIASSEPSDSNLILTTGSASTFGGDQSDDAKYVSIDGQVYNGGFLANVGVPKTQTRCQAAEPATVSKSKARQRLDF